MIALILANKDDQVATAVFRRLENTGHQPLFVTAEDLAVAAWTQHINSSGISRTEILLADGTLIRSAELDAVFNRVRYIPVRYFNNDVDRSYAEMEVFALFISFLQGIKCALINPVETRQLLADDDNEWWLKSQAISVGLAVCDSHFTSCPRWQGSKGMTPFNPQRKSVTAFYRKSPNLVWENQPVLFMKSYDEVSKVTVVGEAIFGAVPAALLPAIKKLARITGCLLLELRFVHTSTGNKLGQLVRHPLFATPEVVDALACLMVHKINQHS